MHGNIYKYKEGRAPKNWCFWTVLLENTFESTLESQEIRPVNLKGNQPWKHFGMTDAETSASILEPPDTKSWLLGKDSDAGRLRAGGEGGDRGWAGWMASLIQWTWTWANSGRWLGTGKPGVLQSMGLQRVRHDLATEQRTITFIKSPFKK